MGPILQPGRDTSTSRRLLNSMLNIVNPLSSIPKTFFSAGVLEYTPPSTATSGNTNTTAETPVTGSPGTNSGEVETISPMFMLWGNTTGITTGITILGAVLWLLWERRANRLRMEAFQEQWPELSKRIRAFS